jgi:GH43 family beta-xylosidase
VKIGSGATTDKRVSNICVSLVRNNTCISTNANDGAYGPGHNGFFILPDGTENWIIYHANDSSGQGCGDSRNPRMQKFAWNADGTPNFGNPVATNTSIKKPSRE